MQISPNLMIDDPMVWKSTPALFAHYCSGNRWYPAEHLVMLSNVLMDVADGKINHLMISMPPRSGKSELTSKYFPAWFLGQYPDKRIILSSYESDFAAQWGYKARNILSEHGHLFGVKIAGDSSAKDRWDIAGHLGGMNTAGVGSAITGKGAHCLSGETRIHTNFGLQRIDEVVRKAKYDERYNNRLRVLSYDHRNQRTVWKRVKATRIIRDRRLLEITTSSGHKVRATDEHRFFVRERGYTEAGNLCAGDRVIVAGEPIEQGMRILRGQEVWQENTLQRLLYGSAKSNRGTSLCHVRRRVREAAIRVPEIIETRTRRFLLFTKMFTESSRCEKRKEMRAMWNTNAGKKREHVLFKRMYCCISSTKKDNLLSGMWKRFSSVVTSDPALFSQMRRFNTLKENDRAGKSELQRREELFKVVRFNEAVDTTTGHECMRGVPRNEGYIDTSCRRGHPKQRGYELNNALQDLPYYTPQISYDTVSTVADVSGDTHTVYDIQVEDCNNFFAENILVHNCLIIDDPVKNAEEANSKTYRDKTYEWYKSTAYTRLEPGGSVVLIMTRWHSDDLAGRLLQDEPDKWTVINLPAIAEDNDMLGRQPGEALFPKRFNVDALMEIKKTVGPYWWNALYQQRPSALEGSIFKKQYLKYGTLENGLLNLVDENGNKKVVLSECLIFQTCDPAVSTKASSDYFVLGTWALTKSYDLIWLDDIRTRLEGPDQINLFKQAHLRWKPAVQLVESVGVGKTLFQMLKREGLPVVELKADTDKVTRALPAAARMEAGCVYLLRTLPDLADIEDELLSFPKGSHDDVVDVLSYAIQYAISKSNLNTKLDLSALMQTTSRRT